MSFLETKVDKFTFKVDTTCFYNQEGIWVRVEGTVAHLGLSDFLQQSSGDIAFVDVEPVGKNLKFNDEFSSVETIKVDVALHTPVTGKIININPALENTPEVINQDPYGEGWLCEIELENWENDLKQLLDPDAYFIKMKQDAEDEIKKQ